MQYKLLGELVNRKIGYGIVQPGQSVPNGVPVIKVNNLIAGLNSPLELDTTTHENDSKYSRTRLHGGELIISVVGTIGKTAIVPKSFDGCNLVRATALIDIDNELIAKWVKYYIDSSAGQSYIEQNLNTTVQPTLNIKSLVQMPIPFFDESIMKGTVSLLSSLDDKIRVNNKINDNLAAESWMSETSISPDISLGKRISLKAANLLFSKQFDTITLIIGVVRASKSSNVEASGNVISNASKSFLPM